MKFAKSLLLACTALSAAPALADEAEDQDRGTIVVTAAVEESESATKTDTPAVQVPQPVTVIPAEIFTQQGAVSVSDTLNYAAGVRANPYGPDSRVDGQEVRGLQALQFRDGMRDIFSYYASIRADPYNFSQVELIRGPASVLFGAGSLGGLVNMVSKTPEFSPGGEISLRYGSFDRKEALADVTGPITDEIAGRIVARVRDSGSQTDYVPDDRIMLSPSLTFAPTMDTKVTLLGLYQEDDGGSTSQFLPLVGTLLPNVNGELPSDLFIGKPGWDRYDGRLLQGTVLAEHRFNDAVKVNLKARYIDSDLTYLTHYPDSYTNPTNPYVLLDETGAPVFDENGVAVPDPLQRTIGLYSDGSVAGMEIFSTDNNVQLNFDTGEAVEHVVLAGVDYSWNRVRKTGGYGYEYIDIYDIDYDALSDYGGGLPAGAAPYEDVAQDQLGFYLQDQIRLWDRVSLVLGARHDTVKAINFGGAAEKWNSTTYRAGIIGEVVTGVSPFFSYTESFEPVSGTASNGEPFVPTSGRQFEAGVKFHPSEGTIVTLTAFHIRENNTLVDDPETPDPFDQMQTGYQISKGVELEASVTLPGELRLTGGYGYQESHRSDFGLQITPKHNASLWVTRPFELTDEVGLLLGGGARYVSKGWDYGFAFPDGLVTPGYTLVDGFAELTWDKWSLSVNATNLLGKDHYAYCLARGDCFNGADRNVFGTVSYRF